MTNREFENYLALVGQLLSLRRGERDAIGSELRDHLELRVSEMVDDGVDPDEATRIALEEFGDAAVLAGRFQLISKSYQRRWMMRFATFSIIGSFVMAVLLMSMWPQNNRFGSPETAVAQESDQTNPTSNESDADKTTGVSAIPITGENPSTASIDNHAILLKLESKISLDYDENSLSEILEDLREKWNINIILDQSAIEDSLDLDTPLTFKIDDVRAKNALRLMLSEHNSTFIPRDGILRLISLDVADDPEFFVRRIYDVNDLLSKIRKRGSGRIGLPLIGDRWSTFELPDGWRSSPVNPRIGVRRLHGPKEDSPQISVMRSRSPANPSTWTTTAKRWAMEAQMDQSPEALAKNTSDVSVARLKGKRIRLIPEGDENKSGVVGVMVVGNQQQAWFFTLRGAAKDLVSNEPAFNQFLKSVKFNSDISTQAASSPSKPNPEFNPTQQLLDTLYTTVAPDAWDQTNGDGTCQVIAGLMVVIQTQEIQSEIEDLLNDMAHALSQE